MVRSRWELALVGGGRMQLAFAGGAHRRHGVGRRAGPLLAAAHEVMGVQLPEPAW
ncbi:MAG: hypothetical protein IPN77_26575 [Sandaracinaceae bacterium]|nr:hypothetical protein [Sandaracinaceae bacterium]